ARLFVGVSRAFVFRSFVLTWILLVRIIHKRIYLLVVQDISTASDNFDIRHIGDVKISEFVLLNPVAENPQSTICDTNTDDGVVIICFNDGCFFFMAMDGGFCAFLAFDPVIISRSVITSVTRLRPDELNLMIGFKQNVALLKLDPLFGEETIVILIFPLFPIGGLNNKKARSVEFLLVSIDKGLINSRRISNLSRILLLTLRIRKDNKANRILIIAVIF